MHVRSRKTSGILFPLATGQHPWANICEVASPLNVSHSCRQLLSCLTHVRSVTDQSPFSWSLCMTKKSHHFAFMNSLRQPASLTTVRIRLKTWQAARAQFSNSNLHVRPFYSFLAFSFRWLHTSAATGSCLFQVPREVFKQKAEKKQNLFITTLGVDDVTSSLGDFAKARNEKKCTELNCVFRTHSEWDKTIQSRPCYTSVFTNSSLYIRLNLEHSVGVWELDAVWIEAEPAVLQWCKLLIVS